MHISNWGARAMVGLCIATAFSLTHGQERYPSRPIRMIVGFTAGGGPDIVARLVAPKLSAVLGQQVVVDNRVGAGGSIAEDMVSKATPDGYTILACSNSLSINPFLYEKLPYDALRDLRPISLTGISAQTLIVKPTFPAKSVQELISIAKANPGKFTFASSGKWCGVASFRRALQAARRARHDARALQGRGTGRRRRS